MHIILFHVQHSLGNQCVCVLSRLVTSNSLRPHGLPSSSVHRILQARILEWVAMSSSSVSSQLWDGNQVSHIAGGFFTV